MHFSTAVAAIAAVAPIVNAHNGPGIPKIAGLNVRDLKARNMLDNLKARAAAIAHQESRQASEKRELRARQGGTDGQCGGTYGSCSAGYCCSSGGWCGNTADYCYSPGCQYQYGPGCPENVTPAGTNTSTVARTKLGSVSYGGAGIYECTTAGTVALTFDDGPLKNYTDHILDIFKSYNAKGTFFISGNNINKGEIDTTAEHTATIKRMYSEGHQIASHTWTHLDLSAISAVDRKNQMIKNEMALRNILGFFPTYMRPPYSSCTSESGCESALADLGYHIVYFDVDTDDYNQDAPNKIQNAKNNFKGNITAGGATASDSEWLSIAHDIHEQTAYNLTEYMLSTLTQLGYKAVTVGECLGDPSTNWYRSSSGSTTSTSTSSSATATATNKVSTDATCGGTNKYTCKGSTFGNCCSVNGWCGSTTDYCGTGCQSAYGTCGSSSSSSTSTSKSSSKSSSTSTSTAATATATKISTDATCGGTTGQTCKGSTFGNCCSVNGWCGSTTDYCGTGCQSAFGTCGTSTSKSSATSTTTTAATSTATKVSTDGTCAGTTGQTCKGSTFGNCCSQYGWCGSTTGHCGTGCQKSFGTCT